MRNTSSPIQSSLQSLVILGLLLALPISLVLKTWPAKLTYPDLATMSEEDLIGLLRLEEWPCYGMGDSQNFKWPFILTDRWEDSFPNEPLESLKKWPPHYAVQKELIGRGVKAIPYLLDHLDDPRKTKGDFQSGSMGWGGNGILYSVGFYEVRNLDSQWVEVKSSPQTTKSSIDGTTQNITLRVGDFCLAILGQIVNRDLGPFYGVGRDTVLVSPIMIPELAATIRKEWSGLTPGEHRRSLIRDCYYHPDFISPIRALKRLLVYYPDDGKRMVLEWTFRKQIRVDLFWKLFESTEIDDITKSDIEKILKKIGIIEEACEVFSVPYFLYFDIIFYLIDEKKEKDYEWISKKIYPEFNPQGANYCFWHEGDDKWLEGLGESFFLYHLRIFLLEYIENEVKIDNKFFEMNNKESSKIERSFYILKKFMFFNDILEEIRNKENNPYWFDESGKKKIRPVLQSYLDHQLALAQKAPQSPATSDAILRLKGLQKLLDDPR